MKTNPHHYPLLDLIRYFAALIVAMTHYAISSGFGGYELLSILAVEIFFVLSGFVLARQIDLIIEKREAVFVRVFLYRRWIRTIPPYLVAIFVSALIFGYGDWINLVKHLFYVQNFIHDNPTHQFFSVGWSLSIEEWFYIVFPVVMLLGTALGRSVQHKIFIAAGFIAVFTLIRALYGEPEHWGEEIRRSVIMRLDAIVYGYLAFQLKDMIKLPIAVAGMAAFSIFAYFIGFNEENLSGSLLVQNLYFVIVGVLFSFVMIAATKINIQNGIALKILDNLARVSYPIYLFHLSIMAVLSMAGIGFNLILYFFIVNLVAIIFHYSFENELLKLRPGYPKKL